MILHGSAFLRPVSCLFLVVHPQSCYLSALLKSGGARHVREFFAPPNQASVKQHGKKRSHEGGRKQTGSWCSPWALDSLL